MKSNYTSIPLIAVLMLCVSCIPQEKIILRDVKNVHVEAIDKENVRLNGDVVFFNPNATRLRLKEIKVDVYVGGKKSAYVDQKLEALARGNSEFSVPLTVQVSLKELGLMDALASLFGGKKYEIHYRGHLKAKVNGWPVKVPVDHKEDFKLKF
jgi:LEA14-like dessication related protein